MTFRVCGLGFVSGLVRCACLFPHQAILSHGLCMGRHMRLHASEPHPLDLSHKVSWDQAQPMVWGRGKGCDFVTGSCLSPVRGPLPGFCNTKGKRQPHASRVDPLERKRMIEIVWCSKHASLLYPLARKGCERGRPGKTPLYTGNGTLMLFEACTLLTLHGTCAANDGSLCTADRSGVGYCSLSQWSADIPKSFQYFTDPKVRKRMSQLLE